MCSPQRRRWEFTKWELGTVAFSFPPLSCKFLYIKFLYGNVLCSVLPLPCSLAVHRHGVLSDSEKGSACKRENLQEPNNRSRRIRSFLKEESVGFLVNGVSQKPSNPTNLLPELSDTRNLYLPPSRGTFVALRILVVFEDFDDRSLLLEGGGALSGVG